MKVVLEDVFTEKKYHISVGDEFTMGDEEHGFEKYKIVSADPKKEDVSVAAVPGDATYIVNKEKMEQPASSEDIRKKREMMGDNPMGRLPFTEPMPNPKGKKLR